MWHMFYPVLGNGQSFHVLGMEGGCNTLVNADV